MHCPGYRSNHDRCDHHNQQSVVLTTTTMVRPPPLPTGHPNRYTGPEVVAAVSRVNHVNHEWNKDVERLFEQRGLSCDPSVLSDHAQRFVCALTAPVHGQSLDFSSTSVGEHLSLFVSAFGADLLLYQSHLECQIVKRGLLSTWQEHALLRSTEIDARALCDFQAARSRQRAKVVVEQTPLPQPPTACALGREGGYIYPLPAASLRKEYERPGNTSIGAFAG